MNKKFIVIISWFLLSSQSMLWAAHHLPDDHGHGSKPWPCSTISVYAGVGSVAAQDDAPVQKELGCVYGIAVTDDGRGMYLAQSKNNMISFLDMDTKKIRTVVGTENAEIGSHNFGLASEMKIMHPSALAMGRNNILFFTDLTGIKMYNPADQMVDLLYEANYPRGIAVHPITGDLFFSDTGENCIKRRDADGIITVAVGTQAANTIGQEVADLYMPYGLVFSQDGQFLYIADSRNHRVKRFNMHTREMIVIAGTGTQGKGPDGIATCMDLNWPCSVCLDASHNLIIADTENDRVLCVTPDGNAITIVAGDITDENIDQSIYRKLSQPINVFVYGNVLYVSSHENIYKINDIKGLRL